MRFQIDLCAECAAKFRAVRDQAIAEGRDPDPAIAAATPTTLCDRCIEAIPPEHRAGFRRATGTVKGRA